MNKPNIRIFLKGGSTVDIYVSKFSIQRGMGRSTVGWTDAGYPRLMSIDPDEIAAVVELRDPPQQNSGAKV